MPSHWLNSAMPQPFLACSAPRIGVCVGRMPCCRTSASKNCVITRDTRRTLKHVQFSTDVMSNCFFIVVYIHTKRIFVNRFVLVGWERYAGMATSSPDSTEVLLCYLRPG